MIFDLKKKLPFCYLNTNNKTLNIKKKILKSNQNVLVNIISTNKANYLFETKSKVRKVYYHKIE